MLSEEHIKLLQIYRTVGIGPISFFSLLEKYKTANNIIQNLSNRFKLANLSDIYDEIEAHEKYEAMIISIFDERYPKMLKQVRNAPPFLSVKGKINLFTKQHIAIVGARNSSIVGGRIAHDISIGLIGANYITVSGFARGIDHHAHNADVTNTIAVMACGIDQIYPKENRELYKKIADNGLIVSEAPFSSAPQEHLFPNRNRIIAGISCGTVVIEAASKSGSLITAYSALDYGRDVFAVPGCPADPRSKGCNRLIKEGAIIVESADDIINHYSHETLVRKLPFEKNNIQGLSKNTNSFIDNNSFLHEKIINSFDYESTDNSFSNIDTNDHSLPQLENKLLNFLGNVPVSIDMLAHQLQISIHQVRIILSDLELNGKVRHVWGNRVCKLYD